MGIRRIVSLLCLLAARAAAERDILADKRASPLVGFLLFCWDSDRRARAAIAVLAVMSSAPDGSLSEVVSSYGIGGECQTTDLACVTGVRDHPLGERIMALLRRTERQGELVADTPSLSGSETPCLGGEVARPWAGRPTGRGRPLEARASAPDTQARILAG